jgi:CheY-like chemotaxis protein
MSGRHTILVVDDDREVRDALTELLETDGYQVVVAANGVAALAAARRGPAPCAILLDLMMPHMDGWDFRAEQRRDPALKNVPVVVITAAGFSPESVRAQLGTDVEFVPKPPPADGLLSVVRRLCRNSHDP